MTVEKIIKDLSDAVVASGRPINTLQEAIFNYFKIYLPLTALGKGEAVTS